MFEFVARVSFFVPLQRTEYAVREITLPHEKSPIKPYSVLYHTIWGFHNDQEACVFFPSHYLQAEEFFSVWRHLGVMVPSATPDRLSVLNLLVYAVSLADGHCCPRRPPEFLRQVLSESLVDPIHLDLWMKDLSPDDSRVRCIEGVLMYGGRK